MFYKPKAAGEELSFTNLLGSSLFSLRWTKWGRQLVKVAMCVQMLKAMPYPVCVCVYLYKPTQFLLQLIEN